MKEIDLPKSNITIKAPEGFNMEDIHGIRYNVSDEDDNKLNGFVVGYELDEDELKKINRTKTLYVHVIGDLFPPIIPTVQSMEDAFGKNIIDIKKEEVDKNAKNNTSGSNE